MNNKFVKKSIFTSLIALFAITGAVSIFPVSVKAAQTVVITNAPSQSDIGTNSFTITGNYNAPGATQVQTRFEYGLSPSFGNTTTYVLNSTATGSFQETITGLTSGTTYYVRAYAFANSTGPGAGSTLTVTTKSITAPSVLTMGATVNSSTTATLSGFFNGNNASSTDVKFVYGTSSNNLNQDTGYVTNTNASGNFSVNISGLSANTTYYFRAIAKNGAGITNALQTLSFTTSAAPTPLCTINSFSASPSSINSGSSTTLSWSTSNCATFSIDNGVGTVTGTSKVISNLTNTTTYTLTASASTQAGGTDTDTTTVTVTNNNPQCVINYFYASPSNINSGNSTTIYYSTTNCNNVSISNYGNVSNGSGNFNTNTLYGNTSYTINASGQYNTASSQTITVTVGNGGGNNYCMINYFYANPTSITAGSSAVLYYSTSNCTNVYISNVNGGYSLNNSGMISTPAIYNTTTYTISGYNYSGGTQTQSTTVYVNTNPQPCNYSTFLPQYPGCQPCGPCPNPNPNPDPKIIIINNTPGDTVTTTSDVAELSITSQFAYVYPNDIYSYKIFYKNISSGSLDNALLNVDVPMQVNVIGRSTGIITGSGHSVSVNLGTLSPGESGTLSVDVQAIEGLSNKDTLVAKATLTGTKRSSGATSVTSAYTLTHVKGGKNGSFLAGLALFGGEGFLPTSFGGWIVIFALLAIVIFVGRKMYSEKKARAAHGHTINPYDVAGHH